MMSFTHGSVDSSFLATVLLAGAILLGLTAGLGWYRGISLCEKSSSI